MLGAEWPEFDLEEGLWTVPAGRMKAGKEHRVPLTEPVIALLKALPRSSHLVFGREDKALSNMAMAMLLQRMGLRDRFTVHGFRSSFRDWVHEQTDHPREIAEQALAHQVGNDVERAYRRGDALEKRRELMRQWSQFLSPCLEEDTMSAFIAPRRDALRFVRASQHFPMGLVPLRSDADFPLNGVFDDAYGIHHRTADNEVTFRNWGATAANVGLRCGNPSDVSVVQVSTPVAQAWFDDLGIWPTPTCFGPQGRSYLYFHIDPQEFLAVALPPGVAVLTDGDYVALPGSSYANGRSVIWEIGPDNNVFEDFPIVDLRDAAGSI